METKERQRVKRKKERREEERKSRVVKWEDTEKQVNKQRGRFEEDESNRICMQREREREWRLRVDLKVEFKRGLNLFLPSESMHQQHHISSC